MKQKQPSSPNSQLRGKRGFASTIGAVLAALTIAFAVAVVLSYSSIQHAGTVSAEVQKVYQSSQDASPFFDAAISDAMLASAYQTCGCGTSNSSGLNSTIARLVPQYMANASVYLNSGPVFVNYSSLSVPSFSPGGCNTSLTGTFSYSISTSSPNAKTSTSVSTSKTLGIQQNLSAVWLNLSNSNTPVANVTVTCP